MEDSVVLGINYLTSQSLYPHLENEDDNTDLRALHFSKLQSQKWMLVEMHLLEEYRLAHRIARRPGKSEVTHR